MTGMVFRIERFAIHDGPGIRTTVFLKGCPLRCAWCHSPESQSPRREFMPLADRCLACGACVAACPEHLLSPLRRRARPLDCPTLNPPDAVQAIPGFTPVPAHVESPVIKGPGPFSGRCRECGRCVEACPTGARVLAGEEMSVGEVIAAVERDRVFYDESGGGVTFSGGEPLMQAPFLIAVVEECRARDIHVAVDTSGFGDAATLDEVRPDLFLFDVKALDEEWHRKITGVSNRVILENLARIAARGRRSTSPNVGQSERQHAGPSAPRTSGPSDLIVRFPLVPGLTDADDNVRGIARLVASLGISRVDVLPYHRAGLAKYDRLGRPYALAETAPPTPGEIERAVEILSERRLTVRVGGA